MTPARNKPFFRGHDYPAPSRVTDPAMLPSAERWVMVQMTARYVYILACDVVQAERVAAFARKHDYRRVRVLSERPRFSPRRAYTLTCEQAFVGRYGDWG